MYCPHGHAPLQITERLGIAVGYCPECRGVWLDRGGLDKLLDRAEHAAGRSRANDEPRPAVPLPAQGHERKPWPGALLDF